MLVIVEGVDRTGKTMLCHRGMAEMMPTWTGHVEYLHFSAPEAHPLDEYLRPLADYTPGAGHDIWVDRHYLGELVWPAFFGRESRFDRPMAHYVELFLMSRGAIPVMSYREPTDLEHACADEDIAGRATKAQYAFLDLRDWSRLGWWKYQHGAPMPWGLLNRREAAAAARCAATPRWVGDLDPEVLLVGSIANTNPWGAGLPFLPYRGTSAHFLLQVLESWPRKVALVNACRPDGSLEAVAALWEELGRPRIVALGADAAATLPRLPLGVAEHPLLWTRFQGHNPEGYREELELAAG